MIFEHLNKDILIDPLKVDDADLDNYVLIGGFADFSSLTMIADSYKDRADDLVIIATENRDIAYEYTDWIWKPTEAIEDWEWK